MFGDVGATEFDLRFSIFGIPVRVTPMFWLAGVLTGWSALQNPQLGIEYLLVWIGCLFFSILIHELGHAFSARHYGWPPQVFLYHFGGLAVFTPNYGYTTSRSIFISFAGPGAGFILYGLVVAFKHVLIATGTVPNPLLWYAIYQLEWINLWWGLVNLLPVLPLDGGQISREVCSQLRPRDGMELALKIAIAVSGGVAAYFLMNRFQYGLFPGLLFGMLCVSNFQTLQQHRGRY